MICQSEKIAGAESRLTPSPERKEPCKDLGERSPGSRIADVFPTGTHLEVWTRGGTVSTASQVSPLGCAALARDHKEERFGASHCPTAVEVGSL